MLPATNLRRRKHTYSFGRCNFSNLGSQPFGFCFRKRYAQVLSMFNISPISISEYPSHANSHTSSILRFKICNFTGSILVAIQFIVLIHNYVFVMNSLYLYNNEDATFLLWISRGRVVSLTIYWQKQIHLYVTVSSTRC